MLQSSNHLRLVSWTWQWVHFTQMASTVTRSLSNRAHAGRNYRNCVMLSCQYGPKSQSDVSNLLHLRHEELRQFWRQKGVQPGNSKVFLIKCSVSVYIDTALRVHRLGEFVWYQKIYNFCFLLNNNKKTHLWLVTILYPLKGWYKQV